MGIFVAARGLSLVAARRVYSFRFSAWVSLCGGFSCYGAWALGHAWASVAHRMWDLVPRPGIEPMCLHWQADS